MELESITLENGHEYVVVKEIKDYLYLANPENPDDFLIRKSVIKEDGKEYIVGISSNEEFDDAMQLFVEANEE